MIAKLSVYTGVLSTLGVGCYFIYKAFEVNPAVFPYSRERTLNILGEARSTFALRGGSSETQITGGGRTARGLMLVMQYRSSAPRVRCEAVVKAVADDRSHVSIDCGKSIVSNDVMDRVADDVRVGIFEEHIQATLNRRPFDRKFIERLETSAILRSIPEIQREALRRADEASRQMDTISRR